MNRPPVRRLAAAAAAGVLTGAAPGMADGSTSPATRSAPAPIQADALITVDTDAPTAVTDFTEARHPGIFRFRPSSGFSRLTDGGAAPSGPVRKPRERRPRAS